LNTEWYDPNSLLIVASDELKGRKFIHGCVLDELALRIHMAPLSTESTIKAHYGGSSNGDRDAV
jgi:hypothetical protein